MRSGRDQKIQCDFVLLLKCLILRLLAVGVKLFAMDSEGVRWYFSSLNGAARVHDMAFIRGGFSWFCSTSCSRRKRERKKERREGGRLCSHRAHVMRFLNTLLPFSGLQDIVYSTFRALKGRPRCTSLPCRVVTAGRVWTGRWGSAEASREPVRPHWNRQAPVAAAAAGEEKTKFADFFSLGRRAPTSTASIAVLHV